MAAVGPPTRWLRPSAAPCRGISSSSVPGGGARTRHVFSIGLDLGLPAGVLAQLAIADALGNAHMLGTLLAPYGVVAIPPEIFGHLLPLFITSAPGVVFNGVPPYSLWEHPPAT